MYETLSPNPGPNFFWNHLKAYLENFQGTLGVDAACSKFVNRYMFKTEWYCGIDTSIKLIRAGIAEFKDDVHSDAYSDARSFGLIADISRELSLRDCADICVSSYTLLYIPQQYRLETVRNLTDTLRRGGVLILEFPKYSGYEEIISFLRDNFGNVRIRYFNSKLSRSGSRLMRKKGLTGMSMDEPFKPKGIYSLLIPVLTFLFEHLYPNVQRGNSSVFIIAEGKKRGPVKEFRLEGLTELEDRIFLEENTPIIESKMVVDQDEESEYLYDKISDLIRQGVPLHEIIVFVLGKGELERTARELERKHPCTTVSKEGYSSNAFKKGLITVAGFPLPWEWEATPSFHTAFFLGIDKARQVKPPLSYFRLYRIAQKRICCTYKEDSTCPWIELGLV